VAGGPDGLLDGVEVSETSDMTGMWDAPRGSTGVVGLLAAGGGLAVQFPPAGPAGDGDPHATSGR
jgi:hypothetical protein